MKALPLIVWMFVNPAAFATKEPDSFAAIFAVAETTVPEDSLIDQASREIDMATYSLRDWNIVQALIRAADRGVKIRVYLVGAPLSDAKLPQNFEELASKPNVEIRAKRNGMSAMHGSSYQFDGRLLRTDDSVVSTKAEALTAFKRAFDESFAAGAALTPGPAP